MVWGGLKAAPPFRCGIFYVDTAFAVHGVVFVCEREAYLSAKSVVA